MDNFIMPLKTKNDKNEMRRVGYELEFANVEIEDILTILEGNYSFEVKKINNFLYKLNSKYGDFTLELDFELLTKQKLKKNLISFFEKVGVDIEQNSIDEIENLIGTLSKDIVPYEISTPPVPLNEMNIVEDIVQKLNQNKAYGTNERFYYAFGLHINTEVVSLEVESLLSYIKAYMVLQDYINKDAKVNLARKITPYIDNFKSEYIVYILDEKYKPTITELIEDYIQYNPTRNRSLDLLPILAFIDEKRVREKLPDEKIKPRPAFHYRLSNSMIGDSSWRVSDEWNRWILIEKLANDEDALNYLSKEYLLYLDKFINFESWESRIKKWIKSH